MYTSQTQEAFTAAWNGDLDTVKKLIEKNPNLINDFDNYGFTLLYRAAVRGHVAIVEYLIAKGADVNLGAKRHGTTPLHEAAYSGYEDIVTLLINNSADVNVKNKAGDTPLNWAVNGGRKQVANILLDNGAKLNTEKYSTNYLLYATAAGGIQRIVDSILKKDVDFNYKSRDGNTLLHAAAQGGVSELVQFLMTKGLRPDDRNIYGQTPFHFAAKSGHKNIIELFIKRGVDLNILTLNGKTPLHFAREKGKDGVVELLIKKGAYSGPVRFPELYGNYFGLQKPGQKPEIFALGIVSTNEYSEHSSPAFSPDLKEIYWSAHVGNQQTIFFMKIENDKWTPPQIAPFSGTYDDGNPFISSDGKKLYFDSNRPLEKNGKPKDRDIWVVERLNNGWSTPKNLGHVINTERDERYVSVTKECTLYLNCTMNLYRVKFEKGKFICREELLKINSNAPEAGVYIALDKSYIIFESFREGGYGGSDLYISFKKPDGSWSEVENLGDKINSSEAERFPSISLDGMFLFFIRMPGDMYWVDSKIIDELKQKELK